MTNLAKSKRENNSQQRLISNFKAMLEALVKSVVSGLGFGRFANFIVLFTMGQA